MFLYLLSTEPEELELAQAELWALTGCEAEGRIGFSRAAFDISRAAYVGLCAEVLASGPALDDLCAAVAAAGVASEGFRIEVRRVGSAPEAGAYVGAPDVARRLADVMGGWPDLRRPRERFLALSIGGAWYFGRIVSETNRGYLAQAGRPRNFSNALPARHARALVNLVAVPGDCLVDPCCGVGTCLIEAGAMGVRVVGRELSYPTVLAARENLAHFGHVCPVTVGDARVLEGTYDAAVVDLPYGHSTRVEEGLYEGILGRLAPRVFRMGVVAGRPTEELFAALSLRVLRCARVPKTSLVRHYYALAGLRESAGPPVPRIGTCGLEGDCR